MTSSAEDARPVREDAVHADWSVTREDIKHWYAMHPATFPGFDVAPIILNERRQAAVDEVRVQWPDLPEVLIADQVKELQDHRKSMKDGLVERIAAYLPLPMSEASAVPDARLLPRRPGRPRWTRTLFVERLKEAAEKAEGSEDGRRWRLGAPPSLDDIAGEFRALDGRKGIEPRTLRRLRGRFFPKA
ncbi:MAG TPA: hypothetical protein VNF73_09695 [Candidatus Saccharimonadales bacterium]|nr:hypothetical protein [Candidatus Saccharimonadales bacterium]